MALYPKRKNAKLKGNKNPQEIFYESTQKLFHLLANHPHFLAGVSKIRTKYKLPYVEITSISKLLVWQHSNKKKYDQIVKDKKISQIVEDFKIPNELQRATTRFLLDFIQTNNIITQSIFDTGLRVIRASDKRKVIELKPDCIYLEITPQTTIREIKDCWGRIVGTRKEIRSYGIPATSKIEEQIWKLSQQGLSATDIASQMNSELDSVRYGYNEVITLKNNYKKALSKLRKIA